MKHTKKIDNTNDSFKDLSIISRENDLKVIFYVDYLDPQKYFIASVIFRDKNNKHSLWNTHPLRHGFMKVYDTPVLDALTDNTVCIKYQETYKEIVKDSLNSLKRVLEII